MPFNDFLPLIWVVQFIENTSSIHGWLKRFATFYSKNNNKRNNSGYSHHWTIMIEWDRMFFFVYSILQFYNISSHSTNTVFHTSEKRSREYRYNIKMSSFNDVVWNIPKNDKKWSLSFRTFKNWAKMQIREVVCLYAC